MSQEPRTDGCEDTISGESESDLERHEIATGARIHRYVILDLVGKGGMGAVYKAYDPELDRRIAIKILTLTPKENETLSVPQARLLREAQALAKLNHPNVVSVYDVGSYANGIYIAMEYVEGMTLRPWIAKNKPERQAIIELFLSAGKGLQAAHAEGIVHRDFKPENLIVSDKGQVKILDFGLACAGEFGDSLSLSEKPIKSELESGDAFLSSPLTQAGSLLGTLAYMAPENFLRQELDEKTDQFSFCVSLFEALYGRRPFVGKSFGELEKAVISGDVRIPAGAEVPGWIQRILLQGLSVDKGDRYSKLSDLVDDLQRDPIVALRQRRLALRRKLLVTGLALLSVILPLAVWFGLRYRTQQRCGDVSALLLGVWDEPTKRAIGDAFLRTEKPFSADAWRRTAQILDDYIAEWALMRNRVCEATWVLGTQSENMFDLRMNCLGRRLAQVRELSQLFAQADEELVVKAVQVATSLSPLSDCRDEKQLTSRVPQPDKKIAQQVHALREQLAGIRVLLQSGKYQMASQRSQEILGEANLLQYPPLLAEALVWAGTSLERSGDYPSALQTLQQAYWKAVTQQHFEVMALASIQLVWVVGFRQAQFQEGLFWGLVAETFLEFLGQPAELEIALNTYLGTIYGSLDDHQKKVEHCFKAVEITQKAYGRNDLMVANSLNCIGVAYWRKREYAKALEYYSRALAVEKETLGVHHPDVARSLNNIGFVYLRKGDYDQARSHLEQSLLTFSQYLGDNHPRVVWPHAGLGEVFRLTGKSELAQDHFKRVVSICHKSSCDLEPEGLVNVGLAKLSIADGDRKNAALYAKKAQAVYAKSPKFKSEIDELASWCADHKIER